MNDLLKRKGIFTVSREAIESGPEEVIEALRDVLVVQLENDFMTNSIKYGGYSKHFDLVKEGDPPPSYIASCKKYNNGTIAVTWHREKEYTERDVKDMFKEINEGLRNIRIEYGLKNLRVSEGLDIEKIARAIAVKLNECTVNMDGKSD
jgi:hypothetical protein